MGKLEDFLRQKQLDEKCLPSPEEIKIIDEKIKLIPEFETINPGGSKQTILQGNGFYISYSNYFSSETALVKGDGINPFNEDKYYVLQGNWLWQYKQVIGKGGDFKECLKFYQERKIKNIKHPLGL